MLFVPRNIRNTSVKFILYKCQHDCLWSFLLPVSPDALVCMPVDKMLSKESSVQGV